MDKKFYITTAIAYTSSKPHIGNVYEAILADAIARFKKKEGYDVYFQTGTDEHGQKIENNAIKANIKPKEYTDKISNLIKEIYASVDVNYDYFVRTTDKKHMTKVQEVFKKLYDKGDIYKGEYEGHYCVDCESYYTEKDLIEEKCPDCKASVTLSKEEAYFLKLSNYQQRLIEHINDNPRFILPTRRKNEMLNTFLKDTLPDLCVSRSSYKWGIPVTFDDKHVIYVWIDALMNYISALDFDINSNHGPLFKKYWPANMQLIGKDILRFHTIYWPILLMALEVELPQEIFAHPWILMNQSKMSKSKGNIIYTDELIDIFGKDAVRHYVLSEIPYANDGNLTFELVYDKYNADLANTLGNLVNRTIAMTKKYFDGTVMYHGTLTDFDKELIDLCSTTYKEVVEFMADYKVNDAIERIMRLLRRSNKYIDETAPWVLAKDESKKDVLENVLYILLESIRFSAVLLESFIPTTSSSIYNQINTNDTSFDSLVFAKTNKYTVGEATVLFKRLDLQKDVLDKIELVEEKKEVTKELKKEIIKEEKQEQDLIEFNDFAKVSLVVGKILKAEKHPKADKLLVFEIDIKTEVRTIVSGIAKFYKPEDLVGKKVVVVKNLKPIKLRGIESFGMLLCASNDEEGTLELLNVDNLNPGDIVS